MTNNKLLASLAVFRDLYDSERDVYDVISKFILEVIIHRSIYSFEATEMKNHLDSLFDFQLPDGVIKASAKRLDCISIEHKKFVVDKSKLSENIKDNFDESKNKSIYEDILNSLIKYIETNKNIQINSSEEKTIENEFSSFLLHGAMNNGYSNLISKFIVLNKENETFNKNINLIKEGVILYTGLKFTPDSVELGSWKSKITIYLDIEILFHAVGCNGELFKNIFDDFYKLVQDINRKKLLVSLKYFSETKNEIENFFKKAEYIVSGNDKLNPSIIAMNSIVKGCSLKSDIVERKIQFYNILEKYKISEDNYTAEYGDETYKYNIISHELEQELLKKYNKHDIDYALKLLNNMSIIREQKSVNNFENIGAILLSANSKILKIANHDDVKQQGKIPLATNIDFLTNKFWFKLNKGFGVNDYPKTFSMFTKAQIVLSSHINDNLNNQFSKIQQNIKNNTFTEEDALKNLSFLKESVKKPEDIHSESIDEIYLLLNENSVEEIVNHHEYLKKEVKKQSADKVTLEEIVKEKETALILEKDKSDQYHTGLLKDKRQNLEKLTDRKIILDRKVDKKYLFFKTICISLCIIYYLLLVYLVYKFTWDVMESIAYFLGVIPFLFGIFYIMVFEKSFNFLNFFENKKIKLQEKVYKEYFFDNQEIENVEKEINQLINEDK